MNMPEKLIAAVSPRQVAACHERLRRAAPHVHCLTNTAAAAFTANMLLAAGAQPSLTDAADEVAAFVARADALLINLGTLSEPRREAMRTAARTADVAGKPWLLDPVFAHFSPTRLAFAKELLALSPAILRGNALELGALELGALELGALELGALELGALELGALESGKALGRDGKQLAACEAQELAARHGVVVAMTADEDIVCDAARSARIANGAEVMAKVTGMGCAITALMAGFAAVEGDPLVAAAASLAVAGIAGEIASETANGPGSFAAAMLDALARLDADLIEQRARIA